MKEKISAILITRNEEANIHDCLLSLQWVDEVVLVDSYSEDQTVDIACMFSNCKVIRSTWKGFVAAKCLAMEHASNNWILWIDADERVTASLHEELRKAIDQRQDRVVAFDLPRKTFFIGQWIKPWYPGRVIRLFDRRYCRLNEKLLHEGVEVDSVYQIGHLQEDLLHYSYNSIYQYFSKMNAYGHYGAEEMLRKGKKFQFWKLALNPLYAFVQFYFLKKGFLLGYSGLILAVGSAYSNFIKYANFYYLYREKNQRHTFPYAKVNI